MRTSIFAIAFVLLATTGCSSAYYGTRAMFGAEKRDILVERVKDTRDEQKEAGEQFQTTLERFQAITNFQGGELESKYKKFSKEYENAKEAAENVNARIESVEKVAADMFSEWKEELKQYSDPKLRSASEQKLRDTQTRYNQLIATMKTSASKMDPVLKVFGDQVLFLKHQLNAAAISSLSGTAQQIDADVQGLIKDLQKSIAEADAFINTMK
jgi:hypothetical protein